VQNGRRAAPRSGSSTHMVRMTVLERTSPAPWEEPARGESRAEGKKPNRDCRQRATGVTSCQCATMWRPFLLHPGRRTPFRPARVLTGLAARQHRIRCRELDPLGSMLVTLRVGNSARESRRRDAGRRTPRCALLARLHQSQNDVLGRAFGRAGRQILIMLGTRPQRRVGSP
jgi:hypothetical protein